MGEPWLTWAWMAAALAAAMAGAWVLLRFVVRLTARTDGDVDDRFARVLHRPFAFFLGLVAAGAVLSRMSGRLTQSEVDGTQHTLAALTVVTIAWVVVGVARLLLELTGKRRARYLPATSVLRRLLAVLVYTGAFLMVLQQYGISITPLLTGLGIAGLAAALALQDTLSNFFAGISIQTGRALQPGHFVRLEDKKLDGYVAEVGWRTTWIRTLAGNTIVIPNATLAQAVITDFYLPSPDLSVSTDFLVAHESDPAKVMQALVEEAKAVMRNNDGFQPGSEPHATFAGVEESALRFTLAVRVTEYTKQFGVIQELRLRVLARFRRDGIRVPYPTRHLYTEAIEPPAQRMASGPGGFTPERRPPRPSPIVPVHEVRDPREAEAEKARGEIAAKQAAEEQKEAAKSP